MHLLPALACMLDLEAGLTLLGLHAAHALLYTLHGDGGGERVEVVGVEVSSRDRGLELVGRLTSTCLARPPLR